VAGVQLTKSTVASIDLTARFAVASVARIAHAGAGARASESAIGMGRATRHVQIAIIDDFALVAVAGEADAAHASVITRTGLEALRVLVAATIRNLFTHVQLGAHSASSGPALVAEAGVYCRASVNACCTIVAAAVVQRIIILANNITVAHFSALDTIASVVRIAGAGARAGSSDSASCVHRATTIQGGAHVNAVAVHPVTRVTSLAGAHGLAIL